MRLRDLLPAPPPYAPIPRFLINRPGRSAPSFTRDEDTLPPDGPSLDELLAYQQREIVKNILALEAHLTQRCKIAGKPCDCCSKHGTEIEKLAEEAQMMGDERYGKLLKWVTDNGPKFTPQASGSGEHDTWYPKAAGEIRAFRKELTQ